MIPDWAKELNCSITVCDKDGVIVYQNDRAVEQYRKRGDLIGRNLFDCHNEKSAAIIRNLLATGGTNSYTIEKNGVHKMIFQSAWKENGFVAGLCEISMIIPAELPHHIRG
ncbi:MAG: PAS sensor protein [Bacteroidales bacterium]|jgi:DUF438 domain-containing protein|nr:PAS sensor protein [Bacteroidales bacterium]